MSQLQRRKELMKQAERRKHIMPIVDEELVQEHIQSEVKIYTNQNKESKYLENNLNLHDNIRADEILNLLEKQFDDYKKNDLIDSCKQSVLNNIIKPFGIGAYLFKAADKNGGNVTTIHNFNQGITATEEDQMRYDNYVDRNEKGQFFKERSAYDGKDFRAKRKAMSQQEKVLMDAYTGRELSKEENWQLDHIVSAHEIHQDTKNYLYMSDHERSMMAINDKNLAMTNGSLNQSKGDTKMEDFLETQVKGQEKKNVDRFNIDRDKAVKKDQDARAFIKQTQFKAQAKKQGKELATTSFTEAKKMGAQQILGALLYDFVDLTFIEIKDFVRNDIENIKKKEIINQLKLRLGRIANKIINKWQYYINVFKEGFLSGLLSNIITFIINTFMTTAKNIVRVIREGFFSIIQAVKMLVFPPIGMTKAMVNDAAMKIIASSIVTSVGILGAEAIAKILGPVPFGNLITNVISALLTGISTCIVIFLIDKVDMFNANYDAKHQFIVDQLNTIEEDAENRADYYYSMAMIPSV